MKKINKKFLYSFDIKEYEKEQLKFIKENIRYWKNQLFIKKVFKKIQNLELPKKEENEKGG